MSEDDVPVSGKSKDKLVAAKQAWAQEGRFLTGSHSRNRLPPGQHETVDWPVLDLGIQPNLAEKDWSLSVGGAVENPLKWSWDDFLAQPQTELVSDIHCVTTWSRYDNTWNGVSARHLLAMAKPRASARFIMFRSYDGYTTNVPLARFADDDVLLAHSWQGEKLTREHGGPVRVVIPKLYFWKSAKWLRAITFMDQDSPGYWELRGYHDEGDPWTEQRYG
ncbi:sulfite oxidase-like oxidoreductase [Magnetospirillum gryphiswaldense]|uniref:Oxidoreductase, molybdopterin binding n=1 Tax=Magnetospirillum gryphiswaldense TaxID=55518 RepID=A4U1M8_9PROT|nr:sulfite oxidase-like oxidoreductase [Magnetospirillum gryphiswaldense]AVM73729.1 Sulfoxide reductase catalytic subunit YedY precursor [Magnetospirillum gryphiswaldense MSR-1]AVM77632.1 Sulfoxide reductase catalytic subunit YedY precursor [Magnetospirillum gryphiswaldense]CAM76785.1 Oxidoreductase, molybdopterin binding [Magnetospirillum gryphiswaldense MSR-1]